MATVVNTLIQGLTQPMIQSRLNTADATSFYFAKLFPVKRVNGFIWRTLANQLSKANIAADLQTDNGTVLRKRRPTFESAKGDIPFISISRDLSRSEIKDYQTALAYAPDADATALVEYWGEDIDFCFRGVQAELEYIALSLISNAGKLQFTTANNATFANEFDLDYDVYDELKLKSSSDWSNPKTADIIGNFKAWVKAAKALNLNPKFVYLNLDELYKVCSADQIIKACSSYIANAVGSSQTPDLTAVNQMLAKQAWLNGLQLRVIDQTITRELADGSQTSGNPFVDKRLVISETEMLGNTQYDILQESNDNIIRAERAHTIVKKYGTVEPQSEVTIGQADAVPVFNTAYRNLYIRTDAQDWE